MFSLQIGKQKYDDEWFSTNYGKVNICYLEWL